MGADMQFPFAPRFRRVHLWAAGVAAVICGDFVAWQPAFGQGIGCALIGYFVAALFYMLLVSSLTEVMSRMGDAEGPSQVAACIGPRTSFLAGLMECLKCTLIIADIAAATGALMEELTGSPSDLQPLWWLLFCALILLLNTKLMSMSVQTLMAMTLSSLAIVVTYFLFSSGRTFDLAQEAMAGGDILSDVSLLAFFKSLPAGIWCFLGLEEMLWFGKFAVDLRTNLPRALSWAYATLFILAMMTLICSLAASPGTHVTTHQKFPLLVAYFDVFGESSLTRYFALLLLFGILASLHVFTFVAGQMVTQMAEDSLLPACLAQRDGQTGAPTYSSAVVVVVALLFLEVVFQALDHQYEEIRATFTSGASICALGGYMIQLCCFILIRYRNQLEDSMFLSPFGMLGAGTALVLTIVFMASVLSSPLFHPVNFCGVAVSLALLLLAGCLHESYRRQQKRRAARSGSTILQNMETRTPQPEARA
ncbi:hypothetical protein AK812_SmicGene29956 [Symbiodinium microadriaticum]|uniref:Uncharacterized protein n=1 Tax=Symbiodinium microadriaticum TaxID=2951 RepID=A0A1Q9D0I2_SYMMI|nr:hypothetical protein AK812_SmicGene29956 [Symbiodinium microadriaticum]CAE7944393.1 unnamed protein product [Symbiodinium sp. KB8]